MKFNLALTKIPEKLKNSKILMEKNITLKVGDNFFEESKKNTLDYIISKLDRKTFKIYVTCENPLKFPIKEIMGEKYYEIPENTYKNYYSRLKICNLKTTFKTDEVVLEGKKIDVKFVDVIKKCIEKNWCILTPVTGERIYTSKWLDVEEKIKALYLKHVTPNYDKIRLPLLVNCDQLLQTGHVRSILPEIYFNFKFNERQDKNFDHLYLKNTLSVSDLQLTSASHYITHNCCSGLWPSLKNQKIDGLYVVDTCSKALRNEGGAANNFERLESFSRIQTIAVDTPENIEKEFNNLYVKLKNFYINVLKVPIQISKVSSWYKSNEQNTYDFSLHFKDKTVQLGNISLLKNTFTAPYNVKMKNNTLCNSLCSGTGLERCIAAYLAVNGVEE